MPPGVMRTCRSPARSRRDRSGTPGVHKPEPAYVVEVLPVPSNEDVPGDNRFGGYQGVSGIVTWGRLVKLIVRLDLFGDVLHLVSGRDYVTAAPL
jgi:hypothetical protein